MTNSTQQSSPMMRRFLKPLWVVLALLFLLEAWLWDHLVPPLRRLVDAIPWRAMKVRLAAAIDHLSPSATLVVFLVPAAIYLGMELLSLWPLAYGHWVIALVVLAVAKIIGAAMTAFAFDLTRPKLLLLPWFRRGYEIVLRWRDWAHAMARPYLADVRAFAARLRARAGPRFARIAARVRRRIQATPK